MRFFCAAVTLFALTLLLPFPVHAQTHSYKTFDLTNGLPGSYVNAIGQDSEGFLWVGLETGLYRFDGFNFYGVPLPDTLSTGYPASLFCDAEGVMWIGFTDGSLFTWTTGSVVTRQGNADADRINTIMAAPDGKTWIVSQSRGIFVAGAGKINKLSTPEGIVVFDVAFVGGDSLLVATQDNLHICKIQGDQIVILKSFNELEYTWIQSIERLSESRWAAGTDGAGLYIISKQGTAFTATPVSGYQPLDGARMPAVLSGEGSTLLAATRESGVARIRFSDDFSSVVSEDIYDIRSGLPDNDVRTVFTDREGNLWIGLFNRGLAAVTTNAFSFYLPGTDRGITYIGEIPGGIVMGTRSGLYDFNPATGSFSNYRDLNKKTGGVGITSWNAESDGNIWIGTSGNGLFLLNGAGSVKSFYRAGNPGQDHINSVTIDRKQIWLATLNGVVVLDRETGRREREFTTWDRLPHNNIAQLVSVKEGVVMAATETDKLCYLSIADGVITEGLLMEGPMRNRIQSISISGKDGSVSLGTLGNGLFRFRADTLMNITSADGLLGNYCYSVLNASDGRVWAGHERGFSIVNLSAGAIRTFGRDFGVTGDCLPNALFEASDGRIYIGTTEGVVVYDPRMEKQNPQPPQAGIISVVIGGTEYPWRPGYNLPYRSSYKVQVNYAGLSLSDPMNVVYRTRLTNYDEDWTDPTYERSEDYSLRDGNYTFTVEASPADKSTAGTTASFEIHIQKPFFRTWWFMLGVMVVIAGAVFVIIRLRERMHRIQRKALEDELDIRTAEVRAQKEELFQKNTDITESITYAKRIQTSVLPDTSRLATVFSDAFVFFLPRDIVSGDFYWFDWIDRDRFILVCADSTGHGVPGAFMSMIGTALLQDIITRKKIVKPSQILVELDRQIYSTLNQNQEVEASHDGMDIVVCEFNIRTKHLVFASAMRPVILVIDGEQQYVRGNRSAVGGESASEKFFNDQEYYLREGDLIYLFSDGYPDQFGGHGSKKMKVSRLKILIDEIKSLPMQEQYAKVEDYFFEWKGDHDQIDDVLLMGIKV